TSHKTMHITVVDTTKPLLTVSANKTAEATSAAGAIVTFDSPAATDGGSGIASISCDRSSGDQFPIGTTTVHCQATDNAANQATASFTVTVVDTTQPVISVPANITVDATGPSGAVVGYAVSATDGGTSLPVTCNPPSGSVFAIGTTTVTCTTADAAGNSATASFTVTALGAVAQVANVI